MGFCQVIVDVAHEEVDHVFTYRVPEGMALEPGMRVHVPFGRQARVEGIVMEMVEQCDLPASRVREVSEALESYPVVLPELLETARHIHERSFCTLTQALRLMYPAMMRGLRIREKTREVAVLAVPADQVDALAVSMRASPARRALFEILGARESGEMDVRELLAAAAQRSRAALNALVAKHYVRLERRLVFSPPYRDVQVVRREPPVLTLRQQEVLSRIVGKYDQEPGSFLLYGVTGSGKTEVYMRAVEEMISRGRTAIVLVPEIALTPQMVGWFRGRFGDRSAVLHSRLSARERFDEWLRIRRGDVRVVIGARSAVFAPLTRLGLVIVDEEHEGSYESGSTPRYDAREIARFRCAQAGAALVLASATPSLLSFARAGRGDLTLLEMPERVTGRPLPKVTVTDMREELMAGNRSVFSGTLHTAIRECLGSGHQAILFVNRRGHSTFVSCRSCGHVMTCEHCDVSLTFHQHDQRLLCHYCGFSLPVPQVCPVCGSPYIKFFGVGTQRVEEEMHRRFPGVTTLRMDNDTTRSRDAHQVLLDRFRAGEAQVLIGTQMIAKGLDFPRVTLVGIVAADALLRLPDYKAAERAFQLLTQVAGRAGRAGDPGRVVLQTYDPENPVILAASRQDYRAFYEMEMRKRRRGMFPPYTTILRLTCSAGDEESAASAARQARELTEHFLERRAYLRRLLVSLSTGPAPVSRIMDRYRWQTQLILIDREPAQEAAGFMSELAEAMPQAVEARLEVNPTGF